MNWTFKTHQRYLKDSLKQLDLEINQNQQLLDEETARLKTTKNKRVIKTRISGLKAQKTHLFSEKKKLENQIC